MEQVNNNLISKGFEPVLTPTGNATVFFHPDIHNRSEVEKAVAEVGSFSQLPEDTVVMLSKEGRLEVAYPQVPNAVVVVRSLSNSGIKNLLTKIVEELEGLGKLGPTSTPGEGVGKKPSGN